MLIFLLLSAFSSFGPPMERLPRVSRLRFLFPGLPCVFPLLDICSYWPPKTKFPPRELRVSPAYVCNPREIHTVWIYVCGKFSRINPRLTRSSKQELASRSMDLALFPTYPRVSHFGASDDFPGFPASSLFVIDTTAHFRGVLSEYFAGRHVSITRRRPT